MGRNAAGTYTRVHNWVTDKDNSVKITASRFDAENDEFGSALTASGEIVKLHAGSYNHLNVAETTAQNSISGTLAIGTITAYTTGQPNWWIPGFNNTGAAKLTVSGLSAASVQVAGAAMTSGMLLSGVPAMVISDGSGFHCMNPQRAPANFTPEAGLQDNSVTLAKIKHETTQGAVLSFGASGTPQYIAATTSGYPLVTKGASVDAAFQRLGVGGLKTALFADLASAAPAAGDYIAFGDITDSNNLKRTTRDQMGLQNVVEDTSPQLGGQLDVNGQAFGDGTLELLKFSETGSAVNEFTVANAASGGGPTLSATGGDANVDINITPKGTGVVTISSTMNPSLTSTGKALVLGF